jgi:L-asparaginase II
MLTIDEAETMMRSAFAPLRCHVTRGRFVESLSVRVCDANGNTVEDLGKLTSTQFGQKSALNSILLGARQRITNSGHSLAGWSGI